MPLCCVRLELLLGQKEIYWILRARGDSVKEVLQAVNTLTIPEGRNNTTIVLIQKVANLDKVSQFRPVSQKYILSHIRTFN